ncbi:unnamed protein product, partial [Staurois parvus]
MSLFVIFKFPASSVPCTSQRRRERNPEDRCRHPPEDITGDTAEGTSRERRTQGQGKRRTDPGAAPHGKPECSSGLPLVLHSGIPPGRL